MTLWAGSSGQARNSFPAGQWLWALIPIMEELDADLAGAQLRADEAEARAAAIEAELERLRRQD